MVFEMVLSITRSIFNGFSIFKKTQKGEIIIFQNQKKNWKSIENSKSYQGYKFNILEDKIFNNLNRPYLLFEMEFRKNNYIFGISKTKSMFHFLQNFLYLEKFFFLFFWDTIFPAEVLTGSGAGSASAAPSGRSFDYELCWEKKISLISFLVFKGRPFKKNIFLAKF